MKWSLIAVVEIPATLAINPTTASRRSGTRRRRRRRCGMCARCQLGRGRRARAASRASAPGEVSLSILYLALPPPLSPSRSALLSPRLSPRLSPLLSLAPCAHLSRRHSHIVGTAGEPCGNRRPRVCGRGQWAADGARAPAPPCIGRFPSRRR